MTTREEKVRLSLEDHFSQQMVKPIAATKALDAALDSLSGSSVRTARDQDAVTRSTKTLGNEVDKTGAKVRGGAKDIDRYSGRLRLLVEAGIALGPALIPIGAVGIPAVAGLTAGVGALAGAIGVSILAFGGLGDAMKALDTYQLEPTKANLQAMRQEFEKLGPAGTDFVKYLDRLEPQLQDLREVAREGIFSGVEDGIDSLLKLLPRTRLLVFDLSTALGRLASDAGEALSGDDFRAFFDYLQTDAAPTLEAFGHATGNVVEGLASLLVAFAPLTRGFTAGLESMSQSFADWAANLSQTNGFRDFVDYIRESTPQVLALLGSLGAAFVGIAQAVAPVGSAVLPILTAMARALALIAESPIGQPLFTAAAAMLALNRAATITRATMASTWGAPMIGSIRAGASALIAVTTAQERAQMSATQLAAAERTRAAAVRGGLATVGKSAALVGGLAFATSGLADNMGVANSATLALAGSMVGPWGAALGAGVGLTLDVAHANDNLEASIKRAQAALDAGDTRQMQTELADLRDQLNQTNDALEITYSLNPLKSSAEVLRGFTAGLGQLFGGDETKKNAEETAAALEKAAGAADDAAGAQKRRVLADHAAANNARAARIEIQDLTSAMEKQASAALAAFDAVTQYNRALDEAQKRAKHTQAGIDATTEAGRKNRDTLSQLAAAWNNQSNAVKNNVGRYKEAKQAFVENAVAMGVNADRAKELADKWHDVPKAWITKYGSNALKGKAEADALAAAIRRIPQQWRTEYVINTTRTGTKPELHAPRADGGQILGQRHPYGDKVLAMLAPGEEVISNRHGQADRFRADRAAGRIPGYAGGGTVGDSTIGTAGLYGMTLTQKQYDGWLRASAKGLQVELTMRQKLLQHEIDRDTKLTQAAQDHVKAVRDDISSLRSSIAERFRSPVFGQEPTANFAGVGLSAEAFRLMNAAPDPLDTLRSDIRGARQANRLYKQLEKAGLHGGALTYAEENASNGELQALLSSGNVKQYQRLYGTRQRVSTAAGSTAAFQRYGDTLNRAVAEFGEAKQTLQRMEQIEKRVEHKLEQIRKENKANSDKNAKDTAAGVNGAASSGANRP